MSRWTRAPLYFTSFTYEHEIEMFLPLKWGGEGEEESILSPLDAMLIS